VRLACLGMSLTLVSCASSGGMQSNGVLISPTSLKMTHSTTGDRTKAGVWPESDWWSSLADSQLGALIAEALRGNPSLAEADARARRAYAETAAADAKRQPTLDASGRIAEVRVPTTVPPIGNGHNKAAKYLFTSFAWDLDLWGGERAAWEAALGIQRATEIDAQAARISLSSNVARAYVQLGYAYAQQEVADAELERANEVLSLTQQRVAAGIDNSLQLKRSDSGAAAAQGQKAQADRAIEAAGSALSVLLGTGPDRAREIGRPVKLPQDAFEVPPDLPAELLGHRADLVAARWRLEAADKDIKAAKTQFLPTVNISAMAGLIVLGGGNLFQAKSRLYDATPAISLPILDGGRRRANLEGKDALRDLAVAQYNEALVRAVNEVSDVRDALDSLQVQIEAQQRALDAANAAWTLAEQRFKSGIGSYLEALSVRQELLMADQRMSALRAMQSDYSVQMIQALGGGYRPTQPASRVLTYTPDSSPHVL
jgi:NodT family efflux transporter outer membrane factor (OMF) lipoprotein